MSSGVEVTEECEMGQGFGGNSVESKYYKRPVYIYVMPVSSHDDSSPDGSKIAYGHKLQLTCRFLYRMHDI